ncbi:ATP-binding protein [Sulfuracidifex tepidarius]|uniref:Proteasome-activating nucleotidase n=1 Tax=Sulfuracidifex tepidarius TaxID=1294262 RepID=A0A510E0U4_9CREN|nr:ATP-binding protein [Sulfuracidifex tepidarius]BBG23354.1 Proteasome-activating nucleotidase [Sulfuracidifex tepidarius]BBG26109.1 Proteasome-activating nucleotidase [Sulfuracidifex tepidarius]
MLIKSQDILLSLLQTTCPLCSGELEVGSDFLRCKLCEFQFTLRGDKELEPIYRKAGSLFSESLYSESFMLFIEGLKKHCGELTEENRKLCLNSAYNAATCSWFLLEKKEELKWLFYSLHLLLWCVKNGDQGEDIARLGSNLLSYKETLEMKGKMPRGEEEGFAELEKEVKEREKRKEEEEHRKEVEEVLDETVVEIGRDDKGKGEVNCDSPREPLIEYDGEGRITDITMGCSSINFSFMGGNKAVKEELFTSIILGYKNPDLLKKYNLSVKSNVLLYGPPGNGKTTYMKALAGEAKIPYLVILPSTVLDMYIGNSEKNLNKVFSFAKEHSPFLLAFDEIDSIAFNRGARPDDARGSVVNQLLYEVSSVPEDSKLYIIAATNYPWNLDTALLRSGRLDKWVFVPHPNREEREEIFSLYLKNVSGKDIDAEKLAEMTEWASAAEIKSVVKDTLVRKVKEEIAKGKESPLTQLDFERTLKERTNLGVVTKAWYVEAIGKLSQNSNLMLDQDVVSYLNEIKEKLRGGKDRERRYM